MTTIDTTQRIKEINDAFRRTGNGGRILFTAGVSALGVAWPDALLCWDSDARHNRIHCFDGWLRVLASSDSAATPDLCEI